MPYGSIHSRRALITVSVVLLLLSQFPMGWAAALSRRPRGLVVTLVGPPVRLLKGIGQAVRRPASDEHDLTVKNHEELQRYAKKLEIELERAQQRIAELSGIRQRVRIQQTGIEFPTGSVTGFSGDAAHPTLTINRGARHGLREGLVVVRWADLVGRVTEVAPMSATVRLITARNTLLIAEISPSLDRSAGRGLKDVMLRVSDDGREFWVDLAADAPIQIGDYAYLSDPDWPREALGFFVGKVVEIRKLPDDLLRRRVIVKPRRSLPALDEVVVIVPPRESTER